jgi:hypothetical protein
VGGGSTYRSSLRHRSLDALAFLILPLGIKLAGADGKSAFIRLFLSYVLQSIGELLIMPIGYAMIGKLAPKHSFSVGLCVAGRFGRRLLPAGVDLLLCEFQIVLSESPVGL